MYWCRVCFFTMFCIDSSFVLLFALFSALTNGCLRCFEIAFVLFLVLHSKSNNPDKWSGVYVVYRVWLLFYLFFTKSSCLLLALLCTSHHHSAPKLSISTTFQHRLTPLPPSGTHKQPTTTTHTHTTTHRKLTRPITTSTHLPSTCIVTQHQHKTHNASYTTLHVT